MWYGWTTSTYHSKHYTERCQDLKEAPLSTSYSVANLHYPCLPPHHLPHSLTALLPSLLTKYPNFVYLSLLCPPLCLHTHLLYQPHFRVNVSNTNSFLLHIRSSQQTNLNISKTWPLFSVQPCYNTRSSSMVTLARPKTGSSLKITNRSFQYAAPYLWNQLPTELREPRQILSPSRSPPITHGCSSSPVSYTHLTLPTKRIV